MDRSYERGWLRGDLIAGVAVAALALVVPKNLGYAGVPLQNGLYAAAGAILYAVSGTSRQISTGPSSGLAAVAASAVTVAGITGTRDVGMANVGAGLFEGMPVSTSLSASSLNDHTGARAGVVLLPYAFTRWQPGAPPWPVVVRAIGVVLIAMGGVVVAWAFAQFAAEGVGVPIPGEPNSQRLTVGGPYRYVRNPLYVASVMAIIGQALLLSRPVLLIYAAAFLAITFFLVHWIEDPALARRFGQLFEDYRTQVPGWWPRPPRRTPPTSHRT